MTNFSIFQSLFSFKPIERSHKLTVAISESFYFKHVKVLFIYCLLNFTSYFIYCICKLDPYFDSLLINFGIFQVTYENWLLIDLEKSLILYDQV
jgi:hypothetical protein